MLFPSRREAGQALAERISQLNLSDPLVFGVARGGIVVAAEVAAALGCPLDVLAPRKLPHPDNPEVAIGAIAEDGTILLDQQSVEWYGIEPGYIDRAAGEALAEISRRTVRYREGRAPLSVAGKDAILVDDGVATGYTLIAAARGLRNGRPRQLILAVPVGPASAIKRLGREVDTVIVIRQPEPFYAVGQAYRDFAQVSDESVTAILREHRPGQA